MPYEEALHFLVEATGFGDSPKECFPVNRLWDLRTDVLRTCVTSPEALTHRPQAGRGSTVDRWHAAVRPTDAVSQRRSWSHGESETELWLLKEVCIDLAFELELNQFLLVRHLGNAANVDVVRLAHQRRHYDAIDSLVIAEGCLGIPE
jgi:hypothetical protein